MNKYFISILFTIFFINACSFSQNIENNITKIKKLGFFEKKANYVLLNFDSTVDKMVLEILKSNNTFIHNDTLFFVNSLENKTNMLVDVEKLTDVIKNKISINNNQVHFIKKEIIEKNKKTLGISKTKSTLDTSTAILLSRKNNAKYYLHSCISGVHEPFLLKIELILVKTGEIVFVKKEKFYW